jgi:hypothetical protein
VATMIFLDDWSVNSYYSIKGGRPLCEDMDIGHAEFMPKDVPQFLYFVFFQYPNINHEPAACEFTSQQF